MISRYTREPMLQVWNEEQKFKNWLKVETEVCRELIKDGRIPKKDGQELLKKLVRVNINPKDVQEAEKITQHDVIAFTTVVAKQVGSLSRYVHFGLTSSDVVDTAFSMQIQQAGALLLLDVQELIKVLKRRALEFKKLPTIGRTHGMFAEPTVFGLKFLGWAQEWKRNEQRLRNALKQLAYGKLSGAVGNSPHWDLKFESRILKALGLLREPIATQIVPRDRHAELLSMMAIMAGSMERIAVELRHLQRSEVAEVYEGFQKGQKGSSAMPHKKNPISSENLTGIARLIRSYAQAALEDIALWHERDISHSSVERVIFPDSFLALDYALSRLTRVLTHLEVNTQQVQANLEEAGAKVFSGHLLLALVEAGATREEAYLWVQSVAFLSTQNKTSFTEEAIKNKEIKKYLSHQQIQKIGSLVYQLRHVDALYKASI